MGDRKIQISGEAVRAYSDLVRDWAGWPNGTVRFADTENPLSDLAVANLATQTITANPERLLLNPHGVLRRVTPFRLRQEAVLTGALMHEAAHARFSNWRPKTEEALKNWTHVDGEPVSKATFQMATLLDEPRVETQFFSTVTRTDSIPSARGLEWTFQAMAAHVLPPTTINKNPDQAIMDVLTSFILRTMRVIGRYSISNVGGALPNWATRQWNFTQVRLTDHFNNRQEDPVVLAGTVLSLISDAVALEDANGSPSLIDIAREILKTLFPNSSDGQMPVIVSGCATHGDEGDDEDADGSGSGGEGEDEDADGSGSGDEDADGKQAAMQQALDKIEKNAREDAEKQVTEERQRLTGASSGQSESMPADYRPPTADERRSQREAERFLRRLIDPAMSSKDSLSETPSSQVDGAALSAWKAAGRTKTPHFFRRTNREIKPSPPVKIAVLVDVSMSMNVLVTPSAVLSWSLSSAAHDLRNFAGRGQQIQSCLIHWGTRVDVIQRDGDRMPGIHQTRCDQGTSAMHLALAEADRQIPGFLTPSETPENRLLVQFTDWGLTYGGLQRAEEVLTRAAQAGVKMLSVLPSMGDASLASQMERRAGFAPEHVARTVYDPSNPHGVWTEAEQMLSR